ncbi:MAG: polysaccharide biosynthesis C-terminal domain-containing protein [Bacteroidota bacterium]
MSIKKLASETAIYGVSSILGRILNFALVPLYTSIFEPTEYSRVSILFTAIAFLMIFFTYRVEVAYFRFGTDTSIDRKDIFDTSLSSLVASTFLLGILFFFLSPLFAASYQLEDFQTYLYICVGIICLDTLCELPYAELRLSGRPIRFAAIRLTNIFINLGLNLFFLLFCPWALEQSNWSILHPFLNYIYSPSIGLGYIFIANFIASGVSFLLLSPTFRQYRFFFDITLWKKMMRYVLPLVVVGFAYLINEMLDKLLIPKLYNGTEEEAKNALGIYAANYKLAILISLFTQAFRYGAEPFFFKNRNQKNASFLYAEVAKYFLIFSLVGFLVVTLYLDLFKHLIRNPAYWEGLTIIPIVLMANVLAGLYYNFSVWYKLLDKTEWGAYISVGGAVVTIILNIWWIPILGYLGSAWATLICYTTMTAVCYWAGKKYYPIPYPIFRMLGYTILAIGIYLLSYFLKMEENLVATLGINSLLLLLFLSFIYSQEAKNVEAILNEEKI